MTCLTLEELEIKANKLVEYQKNLMIDIHSDRPFVEKKYLKEFNKTIERDRKNNYCNNSYNYNGREFFTNYYSINNVSISDINNTYYIGNSSPSPF